MIPAFTMAGVLPPFEGTDPGAGGISPYGATLLEVAQRFCTSPERTKLMWGLLQLRKSLASLGIVDGVQWLDGSFCEEVEISRGRPPGDIDVVTLFMRPAAFLNDAQGWLALANANAHLFVCDQTKNLFSCDAFYVDVVASSVSGLIQQVTYWHGLFTHQRDTYQWKGIVQVPLTPNDDEVAAYLNGREFSQ